MYVAVSNHVVSGILVWVNQQLVYYINKVLLGSETRYTRAEQIALALVFTSHKLQPYFSRPHN